jgi:hypothetical protein
MPHRPMRISQRQFGSARILDLQGPFVGLSATARVEQALGSTPTPPSLLVVNLALATELDEAVVRARAAGERDVRRAGGVFRVAVPPDAPVHGSIRRSPGSFNCFDSVEDALADVRASLGRPLYRRASARVAALCATWRRRFW